ncbi:uncharacterized protein [Drosophila tropicalis]|uniref:uncharacterized protein n=1 Tax=Drosophila tropicalis TaxID=46794 RepID=UPI0035ABD1C9
MMTQLQEQIASQSSKIEAIHNAQEQQIQEIHLVQSEIVNLKITNESITDCISELEKTHAMGGTQGAAIDGTQRHGAIMGAPHTLGGTQGAAIDGAQRHEAIMGAPHTLGGTQGAAINGAQRHAAIMGAPLTLGGTQGAAIDGAQRHGAIMGAPHTLGGTHCAQRHGAIIGAPHASSGTQGATDDGATQNKMSFKTTTGISAAYEPFPINVGTGESGNVTGCIRIGQASQGQYPHNYMSGHRIMDLPEFSGRAEDWPVFITMFIESSAAYGYAYVIRLQKSFKGAAKEEVKELLINPANVPHIIEHLQFMYGRPELLIKSQLEIVNDIPQIPEHNLEFPFATKVKNLAIFFQSSNAARTIATVLRTDPLQKVIAVTIQN